MLDIFSLVGIVDIAQSRYQKKLDAEREAHH